MRKSWTRKDWYIMSASSWIGGRSSIEKIIKENDRIATIMVVQREFFRDKVVNIFVLGAPGNYGSEGEKKSFVQDTGMGYGKEGICTIQNIIQISKDKIIDEGNGIGINENRPLWVFK